MAKNATSIKRGEVRNPKGRPKLTPEQVEARSYARTFTKRAIDELAKIGFSAKASTSARVTALIALLDRGNGKPTTPIEVEAATEVKSVTVHMAGRE